MFEDKLARERERGHSQQQPRLCIRKLEQRVGVLRAGTDRAVSPGLAQAAASDSFLKFLLVEERDRGCRPRGGINMRGRAWPLWQSTASSQMRTRGRGCSRSGRASTASVSLAAIR